MRKNSMKKAGIFLLFGRLLVGATPVQSNDLYVYKTDGSKSNYSLDIVQKLTFVGTDLLVNKTDGSTALVSFSDLRFFSLKEFNFTGIATPETKVAINVYPNPTVADVSVKSTKNIIGLELYNLQGQKLLQLRPESLETTVALAAYPAGVYLLQVVDESGIIIKKIIKN
jgi:hypothetical protein